MLPEPVRVAHDLLRSRIRGAAGLFYLAQDLVAALTPLVAADVDAEVADLRRQVDQLGDVTLVDRCNQAMVDAAERAESENVGLRRQLEAARARAAGAAVDADSLQLALEALVEAADRRAFRDDAVEDGRELLSDLQGGLP